MLFRSFPVTIGDDTDAFGSSFITINLVTSVDGTISKAVFQCETIKKVFDNPTFPLSIELTSLETKTLKPNNICYLAVWDEDGKKRTCEGSLTFNTQSGVVG